MRTSLMLAAVASVAFAGAANAAVVFSAGSVTPLANVHSHQTQGPATTVFGDLKVDNDVTFTSSVNLTTNGSGVAQIDGPWSSITYGMTDHTGILVTDFSVDETGSCRGCVILLDALLVGGGHVTGSLAYPGHDTKYDAVASGGDLIDTLTITVKQGDKLVDVDSLRQVKIGLAVPEPATWATMLLGFGMLGAALRRRAKASAAVA